MEPTKDTPLAWPFRYFCEEIANIGTTTGYKEVNAGRLIVTKVGRKTLVTPERGREWLRSREVAVLPQSRNPHGKRGKQS